jgi:hypothetical protein
MHRLGCLVVIGALAVVVSVVAAGPGAAAKGGNNDTAKLCQNGGWKTLVSHTGDPFVNAGDCVNDGAQGLSVVPPSAGAAACAKLVQGSFSSGEDETLWSCSYPVPPNPEMPQSLLDACGSDSEGMGFLDVDPGDGSWTATCESGE